MSHGSSLAPPTLGSPSLAHRTLFPAPLGTILLPSPSSILSPRSKQRHNKLWRQQTDSNLQQPVDDPAGPGDFLPETPDGTLESQLPCLDDATQPGLGPPLPCCFRRLSDPLLPSPEDETGSLVHLQDPEREALLEEAALPAEVHRPARQPQQGSGLCEKDVKKKLEFGSPKGRSGSLPQVEETDREEGLGAGSWGRLPTQLDQNLLNSENLNNNNSKRSCPDGTEVGRTRPAGWHTSSLPSHSDWPTSASVAGTTGTRHHTQLIFFYCLCWAPSSHLQDLRVLSDSDSALGT